MNRDTEDVPLPKILEYVTPEELQKFENQDFEDEHERERIRLLTLKPRGRPRKLLLPGNTTKTPQAKGTLSTPGQSYTAFRAAITPGEPKRKGRPKGWRKNAVVPTINATVPSFNGPQPMRSDSTPVDSSTREQSVEDETPLDIQARTGVYAMVAASGLMNIDSETEPEASRDITPFYPSYEDEDGPSSKRRRIDINSMSDFNGIRDSATGSPLAPPAFTRKPSEPYMSDEEEREALLGQFKGQNEHQKQTSTSSEDSILSTIIVKPKILDTMPPPAQPAQTTPNRAPKRTSLTPHFPLSRLKIPSTSGRKKSQSSSKPMPASPTTARRRNNVLPNNNLQRSSPRPQPTASLMPTTVITTAKSLAPRRQNIFRDITSYFAPKTSAVETMSISQTQASTMSMKLKFSKNPEHHKEIDVDSESDEEASHSPASKAAHHLASSDSPASGSVTSFIGVRDPAILSSIDRLDPRLRNIRSHISDSNGSEDDDEESDVEMVNQTPQVTYASKSDDESVSSTDSILGTIVARRR